MDMLREVETVEYSMDINSTS
jgi:hypothetical protein